MYQGYGGAPNYGGNQQVQQNGNISYALTLSIAGSAIASNPLISSEPSTTAHNQHASSATMSVTSQNMTNNAFQFNTPLTVLSPLSVSTTYASIESVSQILPANMQESFDSMPNTSTMPAIPTNIQVPNADFISHSNASVFPTSNMPTNVQVPNANFNSHSNASAFPTSNAHPIPNVQVPNVDFVSCPNTSVFPSNSTSSFNSMPTIPNSNRPNSMPSLFNPIPPPSTPCTDPISNPTARNVQLEVSSDPTIQPSPSNNQEANNVGKSQPLLAASFMCGPTIKLKGPWVPPALPEPSAKRPAPRKRGRKAMDLTINPNTTDPK
ncbi:hypothetical protein APHAL10511_005822 [Amanita phalloides]|nr:hypothetical protein APHAL10511_005822 [Amanita phalloides]